MTHQIQIDVGLSPSREGASIIIFADIFYYRLVVNGLQT
ncbi:hypothetical protein PP2015_1700 [Pseudoalteromonas phenolica]|uniref:Uncharacterized protein n=1 Tax=Pseudoalteromonas phenolica TaxID=161398 RepID=A0A0S2K132_9GAMM|nr:hypothetical protein PP2015_1700 [Pseudoalteromonas phenolica]MBE0356704.1 hypothetical protein [Pseudoalteromonas phenolica O-BC30]